MNIFNIKNYLSTILYFYDFIQKKSSVLHDVLISVKLNFEMQNGNPFTENNAIAILDQVPIAAAPTTCGTEYQHHPDFFKLPASSPYDNFLKAAGG